jgi:hypothetical protein
MRREILLAACLLIVVGTTAEAGALGPLALGFHLIPSIETHDGQRSWDVSLSLGVTLNLTPTDALEFTAIMDSMPSALGTTVSYRRAVTDHVALGAGLTALWPVTANAQVQTPLFESFARGLVAEDIGGGVSAEASASLPFLTVAHVADRWSIIPLAELPSIAVAGEVALAAHGALKLELTLQPVITDTTILVEPFGRVTDDLLVLPMLSAFAEYVP